MSMNKTAFAKVATALSLTAVLSACTSMRDANPVEVTGDLPQGVSCAQNILLNGLAELSTVNPHNGNVQKIECNDSEIRGYARQRGVNPVSPSLSSPGGFVAGGTFPVDLQANSMHCIFNFNGNGNVEVVDQFGRPTEFTLDCER